MTPELQAMLDQIEAIKLAGQAVSVGLSEAQFNWRPGSDSWSIAECLQHLNVGVTKTLPAFDRAIGQGREQGKTAPEDAADSADSRRQDVSSGGDPPGIRRRARSAGRAGAAGRWVGPGTRQGDLAR